MRGVDTTVESGTDKAAMDGASASRSWKERVVAGALTAVAVWAVLFWPDRDDPSGAILGGFSALIAVSIGLAAVDRSRPLPKREGLERVQVGGFALGLGLLLGLGNLAANFAIAQLDPLIHEGMIDRWAQFSAWSMIVAEPMLEEIAFRLVLMGGLGWLLANFVEDRQIVFAVALGVSALLFGVAHILYPMPVGGSVGTLHAAAVVVKSAGAGLVLGWVFWRWGLPYSIVCHGMANAAHLLLYPTVY